MKNINTYLLRRVLLFILVLSNIYGVNANGTFTSEYIQDFGVKLKWGTYQELEADYYVLERSSDPVHFEKIGTIAKDESTREGFFFFQDIEHIIGFNYYRLTLIDSIQGPISQMLSVTEAYDLSNKLLVFPNPSKGFCTVSAYQAIEDAADILVVDANGGTVFEKKDLRLREDWSFDIDLRGAPTGAYILFVRTDKAIRLNARRIYIFRD